MLHGGTGCHKERQRRGRGWRQQQGRPHSRPAGSGLHHNVRAYVQEQIG